MLYPYIRKLHVSASSGQHYTFSFESIKIILYSSRDGVLMKRSELQNPCQRIVPLMISWFTT